jgi:hypothetical protein
MKTLGLIVVLSIGILVMMLVLIPVRVTTEVHADPARVEMGKVRVGHIAVQNNGWFTQRVRLPELTACAGDREVPLDGWLISGDTTVRGVGQPNSIVLHAGEKGVVSLIASDADFAETLQLYYRRSHFSCLNPGKPIV